MDYNVYTFSNGEAALVYASFDSLEQFKADIDARFALLSRVNKAPTDADKILREVFYDGAIVKKSDFKTVMRALRHLDEVGLCNDLHDVLEEINDDESASFVAFGSGLENKTAENAERAIADFSNIIF